MKNRLLWFTLAGAALTTVMATWFVWTVFIAPLRSAVERGNRIQQEFEKVLNLTPRISANHAVIFAQNTPVLELVTVERQSLARHRVEETWFHSKKTFEIEATFTARAGFNLRDSFTVNIRRGGKVAEITLPRAKILSIGMADLRVLRDEDGLWNKLTAADREKAIRALEKTAKADFLKTDILTAATWEVESRVREVAKASGCEAVFFGFGGEQKP